MTEMSVRILGATLPGASPWPIFPHLDAEGAQNPGFSHEGLLVELYVPRSTRRLTQPTVLELPFHELADIAVLESPFHGLATLPDGSYYVSLFTGASLADSFLFAWADAPQGGGRGGHEVAAAFCIHLPGLPVAFAAGLLRVHARAPLPRPACSRAGRLIRAPD